MRAKMSCPRSSVPNGWPGIGPFRRAPKSISLIATFHSSGPNSASTTRLTSASLWRRKRRHASPSSETRRRRDTSPPAGATSPAPLAVTDAGVEPAIEQVGDEVEDDHEAREHERHAHDDGRVVA